MFNRNSGRKFAIGAVLAGVAGFLVGILTAPKSGKETRDDLKDSTKIAITQAEKDLKAIHTDLQATITAALGSLQTASKHIRKDLKKAIESAKRSQKKVKVALSSIHEGTSDDPELLAALNEAKSARRHLDKFFKSK